MMKGMIDQAQRTRHQRCRANALNDSRGNQCRGGWRQAATGGCRGEQEQTANEGLARPDLIAQGPGRKQQAGKRQRISVDHPL